MPHGLSRPGVLPELDPREPRNPLAAAVGQPLASALTPPRLAAPALATTPEAVRAGADFRLPDLPPPSVPRLPEPGVIGPATAAREQLRLPKNFVAPTPRNLASARAGPVGSFFSVFKESLAEFAATIPRFVSSGTQTINRYIEEKLGRPPIPEELRLIQKNTPLVGFLAGDKDPNARLADAIADFGKGGARNQPLLDAKIIGDITLGNLASGAGSLVGFAAGTFGGGVLVAGLRGAGPGAARTIAGATVGAASGIARGTADALESKPNISGTDLFFTQLLQGVVGASEIIPLEIALRPFTRPFKRRFARMLATGSATGIAEAVQEGVANLGEDAIARAMFDADREILRNVSEGAQVGGVLGFVLGALTGAIGRKAQKRSGLGDGADADGIVTPETPTPPPGGPAEAATQAAQAEAAAGAAGGPQAPGGAPGGAQEVVGVRTDQLAALETESGVLGRIVTDLTQREIDEGKDFPPEQRELLRERRAELRQVTEEILEAAKQAADDVGAEAAKGDLPKQVQKETENLAVVNTQIAAILDVARETPVPPRSAIGKRLTELRKQRDELTKRAEKRRKKEEKARGKAKQAGAPAPRAPKKATGGAPVQPGPDTKGRAEKKEAAPRPVEPRKPAKAVEVKPAPAAPTGKAAVTAIEKAEPTPKPTAKPTPKPKQIEAAVTSLEGRSKTVGELKTRLRKLNRKELEGIVAGSGMTRRKADSTDRIRERLALAREAADMAVSFGTQDAFVQAASEGRINAQKLAAMAGAVKKGAGKAAQTSAIGSEINANTIIEWGRRTGAFRVSGEAIQKAQAAKPAKAAKPAAEPTVKLPSFKEFLETQGFSTDAKGKVFPKPGTKLVPLTVLSEQHRALVKGLREGTIPPSFAGTAVQPSVPDKPGLTPVGALAPIPPSQREGAEADRTAAREAELAKKAEAKADRNAKISKTKKAQFQESVKLDPTVDDLLMAIAKKGGIKKADAASEGVDPASFDMVVKINNLKRFIFTNAGLSFGDMADVLADAGFPVKRRVSGAKDPEAKASDAELLSQLFKAVAGARIFSTAAGEEALTDDMQAALGRHEDRFVGQFEESPADPSEDPDPGERLDESALDDDFDAPGRRMAELVSELEVLELGAGQAVMDKAAEDFLGDDQLITLLEDTIRERNAKKGAGVAAAEPKKGPRPKKKGPPAEGVAAELPEGEAQARSAEEQADLAPAPTTAEQVRAKAKEVEERLAPKKQPDVTEGPIFDLADRKDFEKKQGDLFAPVNVSEAERLGATPKDKKALREDEQARAQGTRKPRTDLLGDPVKAHSWSEATGLHTPAYTLKVNPSITPTSVLLDEELVRGRKFRAGTLTNLFHKTFNIHFKQSRKVLVQALADLVDHGMPRAWIDGMSKWTVNPAVAGSTVVGTFYPESRLLAVREDLLDDTANIRHADLGGLVFPEIQTSVVLRNQRVLASIIAHEIGHSIDFEHQLNRQKRRAQSWSSPLFSIGTTSMEVFETEGEVDMIDVPNGSMGPALEELYRLYESDNAGLGRYLSYPFARLVPLIETEIVTVTSVDEVGNVVKRKGRALKLRDPVKRIQLMQQIKSEAFAQGAALYFTHRPTIKRRAPTFFALMEEIVNGTPETETNRARDERLLRAFQRTPPADDRKVDALEPTDHTAPESRQVREEAARVSGLRAEGVAAEIPTGDPERAYTPAQLAASKRGGFGEVKKLSLRDKVSVLVEKMKTISYRSVRQGVVDQFQSLKDKDLLADPVAHMLATMSNSANSAHEAIMKFGIPLLEKSGSILVGTRVVERGTDDQGRIIRETERIEGPSKEGFVKGVEEILEPLGKEAPDWWKWVVAQRAQQLLDEGREKLFSRQHIIDLLTYADGELPSDSTRGSRLRLYQDVLDELMEVHFAIVDISVQQGTISKKDARIWKNHGLYVPFFRDLIDLTTQSSNKGPQVSAGLVFQTAVKRLKGAEDPLANPMQNMFDNWHHLLGSGMKNAAGARALQTAENFGIVTRLNEPGKGVDRFTEKRRDTVFIREDGKKVWYQFNEATEGGRFTKKDHALVLQSLVGLHNEGLNHFTMRAMRFMKRQFTAIIVANPNFKIANLFRDSFQAAAIAGISSNPWRNLVQGWKGTAETSATNIAGLSTGGFFEQSGYIHGSDPEAINRLTKKGVKRSTILDFTNPLVLRDLWHKYQAIGVRGENVNRAAVFETKLAQGKTLLEASFASRDLLDFTRNGAFPLVRALGQTIPFFQARLQGLDRFGRGAMDPKQRAQFAAVTVTYALASLGLYLLMKDDEDYKQTEQWERDTYHIFKLPGSDVLFRIPRPFELGVIGTIVERLAEQVVDKDAHAELFFDRLKFALGQTFAFNPIPQAALPVVELWGNKNFFTGRPIESLSMKNLPPEERRRIYTRETSVLFSRVYNAIAWEQIEMSPVQIEHLVQGYWGWFGAAVLGAVDLLVTRPAIGEPPKPAAQLQDWPFMGRWVREAPQRHTAPAEVYFQLLKDAQQTFNTIREARERGEAGRAQAIFRKNRALLAQRKGLVRTQRRLSSIQDQIVRIDRSRTLSPTSKRARINALRRQRATLLGARLKRARAGGAL